MSELKELLEEFKFKFSGQKKISDQALTRMAAYEDAINSVEIKIRNVEIKRELSAKKELKP